MLGFTDSVTIPVVVVGNDVKEYLSENQYLIYHIELDPILQDGMFYNRREKKIIKNINNMTESSRIRLLTNGYSTWRIINIVLYLFLWPLSIYFYLFLNICVTTYFFDF